MEFLFSYGTLQQKHAPEEIRELVARFKPLGEGSLIGVLYDLGEYPGLILEAGATNRVYGIIYQLPGGILAALDEYEGYSPSAPSESLFVREMHPARINAERTLQCWVYLYNQPLGDARILKSGRYTSR